jgi:hypothetical protein
MDDADSELESCAEPIHHHVRGTHAAALNNFPITQNRGHPLGVRQPALLWQVPWPILLTCTYILLVTLVLP